MIGNWLIDGRIKWFVVWGHWFLWIKESFPVWNRKKNFSNLLNNSDQTKPRFTVRNSRFHRNPSCCRRFTLFLCEEGGQISWFASSPTSSTRRRDVNEFRAQKKVVQFFAIFYTSQPTMKKCLRSVVMFCQINSILCNTQNSKFSNRFARLLLTPCANLCTKKLFTQNSSLSSKKKLTQILSVFSFFVFAYVKNFKKKSRKWRKETLNTTVHNTAICLLLQSFSIWINNWKNTHSFEVGRGRRRWELRGAGRWELGARNDNVREKETYESEEKKVCGKVLLSYIQVSSSIVDEKSEV